MTGNDRVKAAQALIDWFTSRGIGPHDAIKIMHDIVETFCLALDDIATKAEEQQ